MIAYAFCVKLSLDVMMCVPMPAQECKEALHWYLGHGYEETCKPAEQPLKKGRPP